MLRSLLSCFSCVPSRTAQTTVEIAPTPAQEDNGMPSPDAATTATYSAEAAPQSTVPAVIYPTATRMSYRARPIDMDSPATNEPSGNGASSHMPQGRTLRRTTATHRVGHQSGEQFQDKRPFASTNFREGDLVYGVEKSSSPLAWDRNYYVRKFNATHLPCKISDFRVLLEEKNEAIKNLKVPAEKMEDFLRQEENFIETLTNHHKYKTAVNGDEFDNSAVRRKSKGGLYWATKEAKKHVHFVLDGLDIESVVKKSFAGDNGDHPIGSSDTLAPGEAKNRSVTGAELRWIYRNREDSDVQEYVHFWLEGKPCRPPWQEYKTTKFQNGELKKIEHNVEALWSQYVPNGKGVTETT